FSAIETWELGHNDLLLVASARPLRHDAGTLRARMAREPLRSALLGAWRVDDLEGVYAHFVAAPALARAVAAEEGDDITTDDLNLVEFGFARSVGLQTQLDIDTLRGLARRRNEDQPALAGALDLARVDDERLAMLARSGSPAPRLPAAADRRHRAAALFAYA